MTKFVAVLIAYGMLPLCGQTPPSGASVDAIQEFIQAGNLPEAFRLVSDALQLHPKDAGLLNLLGVIHARRNQLAEARKDFERAVALAPGLTPAWQNLARSCQLSPRQQGEGSRCATAAWQHVLAVKPDDPEARFSLAALYQQQGRYADSLRELARLSKDEAARPPALALRCGDLAALNRLPEASEAARRLASAAEFSEADVQPILPALATGGRAATVVVTLVEALDLRGAASPETLRQLVIAYEQVNRLNDARRTLERLAVAEPANPRHLLELARIAYRMHDLEGALGYLGHARDLTPADPQVHFLFGMILVELKLPIDARKSVEKALALDPRNPDYNHAMGSIVLNARDAASAIPYFQTYIAARPEDPRGHFALGVAYFAADDYDNCRNEMEIVSKVPKTETGAAYFLGRIARINQNFDEAALFLERAVRQAPSFAEAYAELANVRMHQDRLDDAKAAIARALSLSPDSFQANSTLLAMYQRAHDPRAQEQAARLQTLDEERGKAMELMLRSVEVKPY
ncbi:MAG TPA: tetratricopeptide repeat protein [Candidatus Acidoferrales bacterium]|nr:tetratricopeptide repeat protein [Candidatus Acidoferrales bacterium]